MQNKKIILSALALLSLAACGGGNPGNPGGPGGLPEIARVSQAAIDSNRAITAMVSEIGVSSSGGTIVNEARAATGIITGRDGNRYTSYRLDDVSFTTLGGEGSLKFTLDTNGKIEKIKLDDTITGTRTGNSTKFNVPMTEHTYAVNKAGLGNFNFSTENPNGYSLARIKEKITEERNNNGGCDAACLSAIAALTMGDIVHNENQFTMIADIETFGKDVAGLKYSDFGRINQSAQTAPDDILESEYFAGGYEIKKVDNPTGTMNFAGKAVGSVAVNAGNPGAKILPLAGNATLNFANGVSTLTAGFTNWYDNVVIDSNNTFTFGGNYNNADNAYRITGNNINTDETKMSVEYFGDNGVPSEAVGAAKYQENNNGDNLDFRIGFGATRQ